MNSSRPPLLRMHTQVTPALFQRESLSRLLLWVNLKLEHLQVLTDSQILILCASPPRRTQRMGHLVSLRPQSATLKTPYSASLRAFLRFRLRANAAFTRFFSPGFR